jgi:hypothetical protein
MAALRAHESWAASKVAPEYTPTDSRTHQDEVMAAHSGLPSLETQSKTHGAPLPGVDKGPDPRGGAR